MREARDVRSSRSLGASLRAFLWSSQSLSASSSSLPDWLTRKKAAGGGAARKRVKKEHVETSIQLIQHFEFPEASIRVKTTKDGHYAVATGVYKPQMRVWDLDQLTMKFERHTDAENIDFVVS